MNLSTTSEEFPGEVSYGASKHALESYSRAVACELGRYSITVNIVVPGPTQTGYINAELAKRCVAGRPVGGPGDVRVILPVSGRLPLVNDSGSGRGQSLGAAPSGAAPRLSPSV